jgi:hypothetical protein
VTELGWTPFAEPPFPHTVSISAILLADHAGWRTMFNRIDKAPIAVKLGLGLAVGLLVAAPIAVLEFGLLPDPPEPTFTAVSPSPSPSGSPVPASDPLIPDLGMYRLRRFTLETTPTGQRRLRFTTIILNIGRGPLQLHGHDPQPDRQMLVDQQILNTDGSWTTRPTAYRMYFAGDGHHHWHLRDVESYELRSRETGTRTGEKHGFCFRDDFDYDLTLPGAPSLATHAHGSCGHALDTAVTTGISVGWGDRYGWDLPDQYIDITGLPPGEYILTATADALGFLRELCETNNTTTARLLITADSVKVLDHGLDSQPCTGQHQPAGGSGALMCAGHACRPTRQTAVLAASITALPEDPFANW